MKTSINNDELINSGGGWAPGKLDHDKIPFLVWPPKPLKFLKWLFHPTDGYIFPWAALHFSLALLSYLFLLPSYETLSTLSINWIGIIFIRNFIFVLIYSSAWHYYLHVYRFQKDQYRFNLRPLGKGKNWLFGSQTKENIFWSLFSAVPIQTFYESLMLWCFVNDYMLFPIKDWFSSPFIIIYFVLLVLFVPMIQHIHFYFFHRIMHFSFLYKWFHYLHHKNVNVGPWSGLSMHPVEHIFYLTTILVHFVIPSHPIHFIYQGIHTTIGAQKGHSGYERLIVNPKTGKSVPSAGYYHYLHHKYFECNYGEITHPFDKWFGTFHDGTKVTHEKLFGKKS